MASAYCFEDILTPEACDRNLFKAFAARSASLSPRYNGTHCDRRTQATANPYI